MRTRRAGLALLLAVLTLPAWVADRAPLIASLSILPPYLCNAASESGEVIDYRDWHVPLGRRFRALNSGVDPFTINDATDIVQVHLALADMPEQFTALVCADRDEIRMGQGVIIAPQAVRTAVVRHRDDGLLGE